MKVRSVVLSAIMFGCASTQVSSPRSRSEEAHELTPIESAWNEAFASGEEATYRRITEVFAAHLASHPEDHEARNRYGKLLYATGGWRAAAEAFDAAARGDDHFARGAAKNAILAWRRVIDQGDAVDGWFRALREDEDVDRAALSFMWDEVVFDTLGKGSYAEVPLPENQQHLAEAADHYIAIAEPTDEALPIIQSISAHVYFRHSHFADAADRCLRIVERWPRQNLALTCGNVIINMFSATEDLEQLEHYARALWGSRAVMTRYAELSSTVEETLHYVAFQNAWAMIERAKQKHGEERKQILLEAAERFRKYQDEFPNSPHADKALYNALAQYLSLGAKDDARTVASLLVEDYPRSPAAREARHVLASLR